ncbi:MAG TPA: histidine phosphatase family protein [Marinobacter sp.]|nr:histidine phosphatase family protein [Marinobacter sp.]
MATIYLVRHGQASFGAKDYDRLSPIGWQQGRVLGRSLVATAKPQAVFGGTLRRHRETVEAVASGFGDGLPAMQVASGFDEFDHVALIRCHRPQWQDHSVMVRDLAVSATPAKMFQVEFIAALQRWASGRFDRDYVESWPGFKARVLAAMDKAISYAAGRDLLVATSGGPIAVIVQTLLDLSDERTLDLHSMIANTSVSRVLYSGRRRHSGHEPHDGSRRSLAVFNNYSHLEAEDPALVTFR